MSSSPAIVTGQIVFVAAVLDQAGRNPKTRPLVIVSDPSDPEDPDIAIGVALSRQYRSRPADIYVKIPWQRNGHPVTQVREDCAAICDWLVEFPIGDITHIRGRVPGPELARILEIVRQLP